MSIQAADQSSRGDLPDLQRIGRNCCPIKRLPAAETGDQVFPIGRKRQGTDLARSLRSSGSRADRSLPATARVPFRHRCPTARHDETSACSAVAHGQQAMVGGRERHAMEHRLPVAGRQFPHESPRGGVPQPHGCCRRRRRSVAHRAKSVPPGTGAGSFQGRIAAPAFSRSQTLAVLSALVLTSCLPSVEKPTGVIAPSCPLSVTAARSSK